MIPESQSGQKAVKKIARQRAEVMAPEVAAAPEAIAGQMVPAVEGKYANLQPGFVQQMWKPGQSGNPGGRPKRKPISELYARMMESPEDLKLVEDCIRRTLKGKSAMASCFAIKEMTDRVEGRVTEKIELNGELALSIAERMRRAKESASLAPDNTPYNTIPESTT